MQHWEHLRRNCVRRSYIGFVAELLLCFVATEFCFAQELDLKSQKLVATQSGDLPILLSAPHGGSLQVPATDPREGKGLAKGPSGFFTSRDTGTEELCYAVAAAIEQRLQRKPYYVAARFHRRYIDPNRPAEIGYEDPDAKPVYEEFHNSLARFATEVQTKYGSGLLLDIHGQGSARDTVFRGTQNGKTVTLLRQRFGESAHSGPESFFGLLDACGWTVFPQGTDREQSGFTGGYIVQTYGSDQASGIDAIQLEFGADYRSPTAARKRTAATLAAAVESYLRLYLR